MADELKLASVFGPNMVLQRGAPIRVWGSAQPGAAIDAELAGRRAEAKAGEDGRWCLALPEAPVGGPYELIVRSGAEACRLSNVLVGDVWLCSGQSNMEWTIDSLNAANYPSDYKTNPLIRLFYVPRVSNVAPQFTLQSRWCVATTEDIKRFSAVGFFFGRRLQDELDVPIGLIDASWGGTSAEAWTPREDLLADPDLKYLAERVTGAQPTEQPKPHVDPGNKGFADGWAKRDADESAWKVMDLPKLWQAAGMSHNGAVWFRKHVKIPASWVGQPLVLCTGAQDDFDTTYVNGFEVGATGIETQGFWTVKREYTVPARFVREDDTAIAVRVFDQWGNGGFVGPASAMQLRLADAMPGDPVIRLDGPWLYRVELALPYVASSAAIEPTTLYNGMIHPLVGAGIRGAIWYQGETNASRAEQYRSILSTLINAWRKRWGIGDFPFLVVQLANFNQTDSVAASAWAELREAQHKVSLEVPNVGLATAIDIGEAEDIHPQNKREVGERLALEALRIAYGQASTRRSPVYRSHAVAGERVTIRFDHAPDGLRADGPVKGVYVAGDDRVFHKATATIDGDTLVVTCPQVMSPKSVRYAWLGNPENNLRSASGLPVLPFRTDDWAMVTKGAK